MRALIKPLKRVMVACEGKGEEAYTAVLGKIVKSQGIPFHLDPVALNPGAGDPLALMRRAVQEKKKKEALRGPYSIKVALLDLDRVIGNSQMHQQTEKLAKEHGIDIIWQDTCHEAVLLRHIDGYQTNRPPTTAVALQALKAVWDDYNKGWTQLDMVKHGIDIDAIKRAADVEPALASLLLKKIGLI